MRTPTWTLCFPAMAMAAALASAEERAGAKGQAERPIVEYAFDGAAVDGSGNHLQSKIVGAPQFVPGRKGKCLKVDGNTWIDTGLMEKDLGSEFTVECWVSPAAVQRPFAGIFGNETRTGNGFTLDQWNGQTNAYTANFGIGDGRYVRSDAVSLRPGVWQHVAYVKTPEGNVFFLNGIPVAEVRDRHNIAPSPGTVLVGRGGAGVPAFQGLIDEFRVWNRALGDFHHARIGPEEAVATLASLTALDIEPVAPAASARRGTAVYRIGWPERMARCLPPGMAGISVSVAARPVARLGPHCMERSLPDVLLARSAGFCSQFSVPGDLAPGCWHLVFTSRMRVGEQTLAGRLRTLTLVVPPGPQCLQPRPSPESVPAAAPPARSRRIEAGWRISTDPQNRGRQERWFQRIPDHARSAPVPGTIQQVFPGYHGVAWFWSELDGLRWDEERSRCTVHFGSADYYAEVWLNGRRLGDHEGSDFPFEFDVGAALKPVGKNLLAVRVINPGPEPIEGFRITEVPHSFKQSDHYTFGGNANSGGILLPVELRVGPLVCVTDLFCRADPATGEVALRIAVDSASQETLACRLTADVDRQDSDHAVPQCARCVEVSVPPGTSELTLPLAFPQPKLWSPHDPNLYCTSVRLETKVSGAALVAERRQRFGFRDFRVGHDGYFRLNGRRLFLKSCHTVNNFPVAIGVAHKPELLTRDLLYAKAMGFDMVRFLGGPPLPEQLRFCDEIGLMVYAEPRGSWCLGDSPWMAERFDRSLAEMIVRNRNHPSIVVWGLLNETNDGPVFRHALGSLPLVRSLDKSRLVLLNSGGYVSRAGIGSLSNPGSAAWEFLWGDESAGSEKTPGAARGIAGDVHRYMWVPHTPADIAMLRGLGGSQRPVFLSEYGVGSLVNCTRLARLHQQDGSPAGLEDFAAYRAMSERLGADLKRFGMESVFTFPEDLLRQSERLHAKHRIIGYNAVRSNPKLCGYSLTGIIDQPAGEGLLTEWRELKLGTMDAMNDCLAPLRWCLFVEPMHVYAGRPFRVEAVMANDGVLGPGKYPARFRIRGPEGLVWEKRGNVVVPAAGSPDQIPLAVPVLAEDVTIAGPAGVYTLAAELEQGGAPRGERLEFHLSRTENLPKMHHAAAVVGIAESAQAWLVAHGVRCRPFDSATEGENDNSVVLVGDGPALQTAPRLARSRAAHVEGFRGRVPQAVCV